jgi:putative ABC transport system permease protein
MQGEGCRDGENAPAALGNRTFASRYLTQGAGVGSHLAAAEQSIFMPMGETRGIVGDAREDGLNTPPLPTVYWCVSVPDPSPWFMIRTHGEPLALAQMICRKLHEIEPARSVFQVSPLQDHLDDSLAENRLRTTVLTFFAGTAISLACLGVYGTLSYIGRMRRREMGLRIAIGASRPQIVGALVARGLRAVGLGCLVGLAMGLAGSHLLVGMFYGVEATDPETYVGIVVLVLLVTIMACLGPAMRIAGTDPVQALREQ